MISVFQPLRRLLSGLTGTPMVWTLALALCAACGGKARDGDDAGPARDTLAEREAGTEAQIDDVTNGAPAGLPLDDEFKTAMFDRYLASAQTHYRNQKLDSAYDDVTRALNFRPNSAVALNLRRDILTLRGDRLGSADGALEDAAAAYEARLVEQKVRIRRLLDEAREARDAGDFPAARKALEDAIFIATTGKRLSPGGGDGELNDLGDEARRELDATTEAEAAARAARLEMDTETALADAAQAEEKALLEARTRRAALLSDAIDAFNREDFERAVTKAEQVLREEPDNTVASDIVLNARRARRRTMSERYLRDLKDSFRRWQVDIERAKVPQSTVLRWPSQKFWDNITSLRATRHAATAGRQLSPEEQAVLRMLRTETVDMRFENKAFPEVVDYLTAATGLNYVVDARVKGDVEAAEITLQAERITVRDALNLLMQQVSAEGEIIYEVVGNVVRFINKSNRKRELTLQIHPVADLTMGLVDFIPPQITELGVNEDSEIPLFGGQTEEPQTAYGSIEELMELVRASVQPELWEEEGGTLNAQGKNLVVYAPADVQQDVAQFLDDLRAFGGVVITIESRFLSITDGFLRDVGVDIRGLGGTNGGPLAVLDDVTSGLDDNASAGHR